MQIAGETVLVAHPERGIRDSIAAALEKGGFRVMLAATPGQVLERIQTEPPACVFLPLEMPGTSGRPLIAELKGDNLYGHLPAVVFVTQERLEQGIDWSLLPADDFSLLPIDEKRLVARTVLCLVRAQRDVHANPLTGLPGNITIMREAERRLQLGTPFAMAYLDVDYFKPFNDKYGFSRGDEVLRMTARILLNAVGPSRSRDTYVGHVGGDDFIFMTPPEIMESICKEVLRDFDLIVPNFYDADDRAAGCIRSIDRQGTEQNFALMSCSIAVVDTTGLGLKHLGDVSARAAEVKKFAKGLPGSNYLIDRRQ